MKRMLILARCPCRIEAGERGEKIDFLTALVPDPGQAMPPQLGGGDLKTARLARAAAARTISRSGQRRGQLKSLGHTDARARLERDRPLSISDTYERLYQ